MYDLYGHHPKASQRSETSFGAGLIGCNLQQFRRRHRFLYSHFYLNLSFGYEISLTSDS
jgi:hypothetical protein